jgi:hypothetical protein
MTAALEKAIAGLYETFAREQKPSIIDGCPCCLDEKDIDVLLQKPLRSLTSEDLSSYAQSAFLTVGSEEDFKYFLPRILEILVVEDGWWPSPEVVGRAIANSNWEHFSTAQQNALSSYFLEVLIKLIEEKNGWSIDTWVCGIARAVPDLKPYLALIEKSPQALVAFYRENSESVNNGTLSNSFWDNTSPNEKLLLTWFQSDRIKDLINVAYGLK